MKAIRYVIYIDGVRIELADAACATVPSDAGFSCSARLPSMSPGFHTLQIASYREAVGVILESAKSGPLRVNVVRAVTALKQPRERLAGDAASQPERLRFTTSDGVALIAETIAEGFSEPTALAFAPDGRVFIGEREGRVRIIRDGRLLPDVALTIGDVRQGPGGGFIALALDPEFDTTGFVFVLDVASDTGFRLSRYREAGDRLGQRAVLLSGIAASSEPCGNIGFGPDGKLYVAFDDGGDRGAAMSAASFNGKVLRLDKNGRTPPDQPAGSPVYAGALTSPRGFDWGTNGASFWVADAANATDDRVRALVAQPARAGGRAWRTTYSFQQTSIAALISYQGRLIPAFRGNLLLAATAGTGYVLRLQLDPRDPTRIVASERLLSGALDSVRLVAADPAGILYIASAHALRRVSPESAR